MKIRCIWALSTAANRQPKTRAFTPAGPTTTTFPLWQRSSGGNAAASAALPCGGPVRRGGGAAGPWPCCRARCRAKPGSGRVGEATPPPRRATQRQPPPPRRRTSPAPATVARGAQEGWGVHGGRRRLAARGPKGPGSQTKQGRRQSPPPAFQGASAPRRRRPGPLEPSTAAKAASRPHAPWGQAQTMVGRARATIPPPGAKPLPMPYGQRRLHPPAAGRRPRAIPPAVARLSPPA